MNIHEQFTQLRTVCQGCWGAINERFRSTIRSHHSAQQAIGAACLELSLFEPCLCVRDLFKIKVGADVRAFCPRPNCSGVSTVPNAESEGVQHDRLASPCFPCNSSHPGLQIEVEGLNNGVIANNDLFEHAPSQDFAVL